MSNFFCTREEFEQYLKDHLNTIVCVDRHCPLVSYHISKSKDYWESIFVNKDIWGYWDNPTKEFKTPNWASKFIERYDNTVSREETGAECLRMLDDVL